MLTFGSGRRIVVLWIITYQQPNILNWCILLLTPIGRIFVEVIPKYSLPSGQCFCPPVMCYSQGEAYVLRINSIPLAFLVPVLQLHYLPCKMHICRNRKYEATLMTCLLFDPYLKVFLVLSNIYDSKFLYWKVVLCFVWHQNYVRFICSIIHDTLLYL